MTNMQATGSDALLPPVIGGTGMTPISEAREQAATLDEMMAVMTDAATRSLSPCSGRATPTDADVGWAAWVFRPIVTADSGRS